MAYRVSPLKSSEHAVIAACLHGVRQACAQRCSLCRGCCNGQSAWPHCVPILPLLTQCVHSYLAGRSTFPECLEWLPPTWFTAIRNYPSPWGHVPTHAVAHPLPQHAASTAVV